MRTRDQKYAEKIYTQVNTIKADETEVDQKRYGAMSHKLPILIHTAGLTQALTFVEAREPQIFGKLLSDLAATMGYDKTSTLMDNSRSLPLGQYMHLTQQLLTALVWYKRFAQSILGVKPGDDTEDQGRTP